MEKLAVSVTEAAELLGVSRPTMYQIINTEGFPTWRQGGRRLISRELLAEWVKAQALGVDPAELLKEEAHT